jgi:hypothetical protein
MALVAAGYMGLAAWRASRGISFDDPDTYLGFLSTDDALREAWYFMVEAHRILADDKTPGADDFLGYINKYGDTNPVQVSPASGFGPSGVLWAIWAASGGIRTFANVMLEACVLGGDTDTVCAMAGCLFAAQHGVDTIPKWMLEQARWVTLDPTEWNPNLEFELTALENMHIRAGLPKSRRGRRS